MRINREELIVEKVVGNQRGKYTNHGISFASQCCHVAGGSPIDDTKSSSLGSMILTVLI